MIEPESAPVAVESNSTLTYEPALAAGTIVDGKFEIISVLGQGGMSTVYRARHLQLQREMALKTLHRHLLAKRDAYRRLQREAIAMASLRHPNIVEVQGCFAAEGRLYVVLELLSGPTLAAVLKERGPLPPDQARSIFQQICDGLAHAHSRGVVHRDLKPANIVFSGNDLQRVIIVDFGIAKILPECGREIQKLTQSGELFGSVPYMSPELCCGKKVDERSDIYSLGCLMFEVLTGQQPFSGDTAFDTINKHATEIPKFPPANDCGNLGQVVLAALEKDPAQRPQSATELKQLLATSECSFENRSPQARTGKTNPSLRRRAIPIGILTLLLTGAVSLVLLFRSSPAVHSPESLAYLIETARTAWRREHYDEATTKYKQAIKLAEALHDTKLVDRAELELINCLCANKKWPEAHKHSLRLVKRLSPADKNMYSEAMNRLAQTIVETGDFQSGMQWLKKNLDVQTAYASSDAHSDRLLWATLCYADGLSTVGPVKESLPYFKHVIESCRADNELLVSTSQLKLSRIYLASFPQDSAEYNEAIAMLRALSRYKLPPKPSQLDHYTENYCQQARNDLKRLKLTN